jgi:hypothetical protein
MQDRPAIPLLVLLPREGGIDLDAIYAIAKAYGRAGLLVSSHGHRNDEPVFAFPAVVCASFAVELYFKFFLMLGQVEAGDATTTQRKVHTLPDLWALLKEEHRSLIVGMHRNKSGYPIYSAKELRTELFLKALEEIGSSPFVQWRYVHELTEVGHMSHAVIQEVLDALEGAATHVMRGRQDAGGTDAPSGGASSLVDGLAHSPTEQDWKVDPLGAAIKELFRGKPLLLGRDSPLRCIPANLEPNAAFRIDELRQAAESIDVSFGRLHRDLTGLALQAPTPEEISIASARVFYDAWGIVSAVSRFYQAYITFPGMVFDQPNAKQQTLEEATRTVRLLHQLANDLQRRESEIVTENLPTLGEISWITGVQALPKQVAWHCILRPGWLKSPPAERNDPLMSTLNWPTDSITLTVAGTSADLSTARLHIAARLWQLELQLKNAFSTPEQEGQPVLNDFFSRRPVSPADPEANQVFSENR